MLAWAVPAGRLAKLTATVSGCVSPAPTVTLLPAGKLSRAASGPPAVAVAVSVPLPTLFTPTGWQLRPPDTKASVVVVTLSRGGPEGGAPAARETAARALTSSAPQPSGHRVSSLAVASSSLRLRRGERAGAAARRGYQRHQAGHVRGGHAGALLEGVDGRAVLLVGGGEDAVRAAVAVEVSRISPPGAITSTLAPKLE